MTKGRYSWFSNQAPYDSLSNNETFATEGEAVADARSKIGNDVPFLLFRSFEWPDDDKNKL